MGRGGVFAGRGRRAGRGAVELAAAALAAVAAWSCSGESSSLSVQNAESCMVCHNASLEDDYSGPGIENPHPFGQAANLRCTECHGGNGNGADRLASHVPPPPEIGDEAFQLGNAKAYFNRLTLAGLDKYPDYVVGGVTYRALDYLRFVNPGDLRVVEEGRGCGACHADHADTIVGSPLAFSMGIWSGALYAIGHLNQVPSNAGLHQDTAADLAFRAAVDPGWTPASGAGTVPQVVEAPEYARHGATGPDAIFDNPAFDAAQVDDDVLADGRVVSGSPLAKLFTEQVTSTCGDCHLGSAGANNRAGDFRSSGCTACHMPYSLGGRAGTTDPNVAKTEPLDPDDIDAPERAHPRSHRIRSVAKTLPGGTPVQGIDDLTCAGCHQGSNRTVMQYWGIRLDQNQDVRFGRQYPANPFDWQGTHADARLFDPAVGNHTFNGRNGFQYLSYEDYDGDARDDTPEDVHHEAGMGCIDCHGGYDLHGGDVAGGDTTLVSRMEQQAAIRCESCHGTVDSYAATQQGTAWDGSSAELALDGRGNALDHVVKTGTGTYWLRGRLDGAMHYVPQTRDSVVQNGKLHPVSGEPLYSAKASYAMGRADGVATNGIGPLQTAGVTPGFAHSDDMDCASCHASWTNTCVGCHLKGEYDTGNNFSNVTGDRIVYKQKNADFTYQSPLFFTLGVDVDDRITTFSANTKVFYQWEDRNNQKSDVFAFSDRKGAGNDPADGHPSLAHNAFLAHSIRGKVTASKEGPRYCVACHLTDDGLATYGAQYATFRQALASGDYGALDFALLRDHFGRNPGNRLGSPLWVHMTAGLGSGVFLFDGKGAPVNPLDTNPARVGAEGVAPATIYDPALVRLNLDRFVDANGVAKGSNNHARTVAGGGAGLRDGATDPELAGPLGATLIGRLTDPATGIVLDSWLDADGTPQGDAAGFLGGP